MERLWGDHFYDKENKKWTTTPYSNNTNINSRSNSNSNNNKMLPRGFCEYVLRPIQQMLMVSKYVDRWKQQYAISISISI